MKKILLVLMLFCLPGLSQDSENYVTVYNENLGLIKQIRTINVNPKEPFIKFTDVAAMIIPASVHLRSLTDPKSFEVLEQNFEYDLASADKILQKYIDHEVNIILESGDLLSGKLLSMAAGKYVGHR